MGGVLITRGSADAWPGLEDVVRQVRRTPPRLGTVRLVAIDGPAGSGKTTLASAVAAAIAATGDGVGTVHLDDLYEGWSGLDGVWDRLAYWVLEPLMRGEPGRYRRYDWGSGRWAEWHDLPVPDALVVEGCGSAPRAVDALAVLRVWVEAPEPVRLARGLERDGSAMRDHWLRWMTDEATHFAAEGTKERADMRFVT